MAAWRRASAARGTKLWEIQPLGKPLRQRATGSRSTEPSLVHADGPHESLRARVRACRSSAREARSPLSGMPDSSYGSARVRARACRWCVRGCRSRRSGMQMERTGGSESSCGRADGAYVRLRVLVRACRWCVREARSLRTGMHPARSLGPPYEAPILLRPASGIRCGRRYPRKGRRKTR